MPKLGLGTVQFGMPYGISNRSGQTSPKEVDKIISFAAKNDIGLLDTAASYGNSELILGESPQTAKFKIITKTATPLKDVFERSLQRLKLESVYGLLFHSSKDLIEGQRTELWKKVERFKVDGKVKKLGVSIYSAAELDFILDNFPIEIVQLPLNLMDQRLFQSGHLRKLKDRGIEIHVRSAFFQGLLLMKPSELDPYFKPLVPLLTKIQDWAKNEKMSMVRACLSFLKSIREIDFILVGVNDRAQLEEITNEFAAAQAIPESVLKNWSKADPALLNPSNWPKHPS